MQKEWQEEVAFALGLNVVGLAAIRWVAENLDGLGFLGFAIAMTPLIMLFAYSIPVPVQGFFLGLLLTLFGIVSLRRRSPEMRVKGFGKAVYRGGLCLVGLSMLIVIGASAFYNVGQGPPPPGWYRWVHPGAVVGEIGLINVFAGLVFSIQRTRLKDLMTMFD